MPATAGARTDEFGLRHRLLQLCARRPVFQVRGMQHLLLLKSLQITESSHMPAKAYALIPAAGTGSRMGAALPKQYLEIAGRPLLYHALRGAGAASAHRAGIRGAGAGRRALRALRLARIRRAHRAALLRRRDARGERVQRLARGARHHRRDPTGCWCTTPRGPASARDELDRLFGELEEDDTGGLLAVPVADTLKRANREARVAATEPRDGSVARADAADVPLPPADRGAARGGSRAS